MMFGMAGSLQDKNTDNYILLWTTYFRHIQTKVQHQGQMRQKPNMTESTYWIIMSIQDDHSDLNEVHDDGVWWQCLAPRPRDMRY
jgi:hypothetical protein